MATMIYGSYFRSPPLAHTVEQHSSGTKMATELQSLEGPSPSSAAEPASGAIAVTATTTIAGTAVTTPIPAPAGPTTENAGTVPAPKRQRRPSVRLGEIGDQPATLAYESHARRPKTSWRLSRDPSKPHKARSLTHIANGNNTEHSNFELGHRKTKTKRGAGSGTGTGTGTGIATKRVRSNWAQYKADDIAETSTREGEFEEEEEEEEEGEEEDHEVADDVYGRDFDPGSDSPIKDPSPVHSADYAAALDSRDQKGGASTSGSDGVRSWLMELGLSRFAPVYEIHEVDDEVLPMLTLEDLKDMGINAVGSRRKMYAAIQKLRRGFS